MNVATIVQILDKVVYICHNANNQEKSIDPTILRPAMDK